MDFNKEMCIRDRNDGLCDERLHTALDEPLDGTCAVDAVIRGINDEVLGCRGDVQLEVDVYKRQQPSSRC